MIFSRLFLVKGQLIPSFILLQQLSQRSFSIQSFLHEGESRWSVCGVNKRLGGCNTCPRSSPADKRSKGESVTLDADGHFASYCVDGHERIGMGKVARMDLLGTRYGGNKKQG